LPVVIGAAVLVAIVVLVTVVLWPDHRSGSPQIRPTWSSTLRAVEPPKAANGSVVFHSLTDQGTFEVVGLDPKNGQVRWSAAASPSHVAPGVVISSLLVDDDRTVVWLEPSGDLSSGLVSVVAADARTGERRWRLGPDWAATTFPWKCRDDVICLTAYISDTTYLVAFDARTGTIRDQTPLKSGGREIGDNLLDVDTGLTSATGNGDLGWSKSYSAIFNGLDVSPDYGWEVRLKKDIYLATLGYTPDPDTARAQRLSLPFDIDLAKLGASAAFSAVSGQTLWVRPDATFFCGTIQFDEDHPTRCALKGTAHVDSTQVNTDAADVTVEGFDAHSGETTWSWHAGNVPDLVSGQSSADGSARDVLRVDDARYVVRSGNAVTVLDLDRGIVDGSAPPAVGWCFLDESATVSFAIDGYDQAFDRATASWYPCSSTGAVETPGSAPRFAGAGFGKNYVWQDQEGHVRGAEVS